MRTIALLLLTALSLPTADQLPGDAEKLATDLVKQLGSPKYAVREAAAKKLIDMGKASLTALRSGLSSPEEEVRSRCETLIPKAKTAEWVYRANTYLSAPNGMRPRNLPLLAEYEAMIGKDKMDAGARELFAEMIRTNGELLERVAGDRTRTKVACRARSKVVLDDAFAGETRRKAKVGDIAAVLFVHTLEPMAKSEVADRSFPGYLLTNPGIEDCFSDKVIEAAFRRLVVRWADTRLEGDKLAQQQFARASLAKPFPEAVPILIRMIRDKSADHYTVRTLAVQALGGMKSPEAAAALFDLMAEKTPLFEVGQGHSYLMCDNALAAWLTMHGKKLKDYGMLRIIIPFGDGTGDEPDSLRLHGFMNSAARESAFLKWKDEIETKK